MTVVRLRDLVRDDSGRSPLKLVFGTSLLALAVAMSSPAFEANPVIGKTVTGLRQQLPATLERISHVLHGS